MWTTWYPRFIPRSRARCARFRAASKQRRTLDVDATVFDRLAKSLSRVDTRRASFARLTALLAIAVGPTIASQGEAEAGLHHRRRLRNRRDHDNRKGKRKGRGKNNRPPGASAPQVDCANQPDGTPCNYIGDLYQMRCCKGVCPEYRRCVPNGEYLSGNRCTQSSECREFAGSCCSLDITCDDTFESLCVCLPSGTFEPCVSDHDCRNGCVCGRCQ